MKIESLTLHRVSLPPRRVHRWTNLTGSIGNYVLVELTSDDGVSGWGEATALGSWGGDHGRYFGETLETVSHVLCDLVAPAVKGVEFSDRNEILRVARSCVRGHVYAATAFEEALLDLVGRRLGVSVSELLGGRVRSRIPLAHSLGLMAEEAAVEEARAVADEGIRTIKIKVGEHADREVSLVRAVHEAVGDRVELAVDANQGWRTAVEAERVLRRLADVPLRYVEQPVEGLHQLRMLRPRSPFPLMADESMWNAHDMADLARTDAVGLASVYTAKAGGLRGALAADAVASAFGIGTNVNGSGETGVGNLANLHLAATMTSLSEACVLPLSHRSDDPPTRVAGRMYLDDVLVSSLRYEDGHIVVPDGPGWGVDVDRDKLAELSAPTTAVAR
ncbi:mandelate racemase/muconate lactonizing enzyme family protein [Pseudonocardia xishanensis]|uniref:Muconate cycloisomerase family protein n=1 Tax=Pseudonocardia xishanensis TaxID=630995 RepID=A0ABP8RDA3_9PSEU